MSMPTYVEHSMVRRSQKRTRTDSKGSKDTDNNKNENEQNNYSAEAEKKLEQAKSLAKKLHDKGDYEAAAKKYSQIIKQWPPNAVIYNNRAACHMMLRDYEAAYEDAKKAVELCPTFIKAHCRVIRLALMHYEEVVMQSSVQKLQEIDPNNEILKWWKQECSIVYTHHNESTETYENGYFEKALSCVEKALTISPLSLKLKVLKAKCLLKLNRLPESANIASEVLLRHPEENTCHYVMGAYLYERDIDKSIPFYEKAFELDPLSKYARTFYELAKKFVEQKTAANKLYASGSYALAHKRYTEALQIDPKNKAMSSTLYFNMAQASYRLKNHKRCMTELTMTLALKPDHVKALMRRARCHMDEGRYQEAQDDLEKAKACENNEPLNAEITKMFAEVEKLKEAAKNDFHVILGVSKHASLDEITKVYWKLMKEHHPDRHSNATDEEKQFHMAKSKEITRAHRLLKEKLTLQNLWKC